MKIHKYFYLLIFLSLFFYGCQNSGKVPDVSSIEIHTKLSRFDQAFMSIDTLHVQQGLIKLQKKYPVFFPVYMYRIMNFHHPKDNQPDSAIAAFLASKDIRQLQNAINQAFPDKEIEEIKDHLNQSFRYIKYYIPDFKAPDIITFMSALANYGAITVDSILGIGLDMFLGQNFPLYREIKPAYPTYMLNRFNPENMVPSCIKVIYNNLNPPSQEGTLLDQMIRKGKMLYFLDKVLPQSADSLKIGYSEKQLDWCRKNEQYIWQYFIQNDLLYNKRSLTIRYYIGPSPQSRGMPAEAPGNIGSWVGWQIVRKYMEEHPKTTLQQLIKIDNSRQFLNQSGYHPH